MEGIEEKGRDGGDGRRMTGMGKTGKEEKHRNRKDMEG
jgi:hypothetical protein